ncbi:M23 family metallopeptidase [Arthrobacter sp.]|uniref:M23 family metallopeptidase n=1 Tax=Arthrobacter sp. TaxID=1667 RepID=UPI0026E00696|nr:M23 family metallopeptidase [Arthrobacter sp.]MDO5754583.1 M23 family metallopeptidase [Arthrobacter sp.]
MPGFLLAIVMMLLATSASSPASFAAGVGGASMSHSAVLAGPRPTSANPLPASLAWGWPLAGKPQVVHTFDPPSKPWLSGHRGVDLAATQGAPVLAPTDGVVSFAGKVVDRFVLTIATQDGLRLSFEPVASALKAGDKINRGQVLGAVEGITHCDVGTSGVSSCLHWGVRRGDEYLNPLQFILDLRPSVLLPLRD